MRKIVRDRGYLEGTHADGRQGGCGRWVPFERVASSPDLNMNPLLVASEIVLGFLVFLIPSGVVHLKIELNGPFFFVCLFVFLTVSSARNAGLVQEQLKKLENLFFFFTRTQAIGS